MALRETMAATWWETKANIQDTQIAQKALDYVVRWKRWRDSRKRKPGGDKEDKDVEEESSEETETRNLFSDSEDEP